MRKILITMVVLGCTLSFNSYAKKTLEDVVNQENKENKLRENYIRSLVLADEVINQGRDTIQSLAEVSEFIDKIQNDPNFKNCILITKNIKEVDILGEDGKRMLDSGKLTQQQYQSLINKLGSQKSDLINRKKEIGCK